MHLIAVVDMHPSARMALRSQMALSNEFRVVGDAADATEGLDMVRALMPDLLIVDLDLPDKAGLRLMGDVRDLGLGTRLLARSIHAESLQVAQAIFAGAHGFVEKSMDVEPAMRMLVSGYSFFPHDRNRWELMSRLRQNRPSVARVKLDLRRRYH